jgi:uncharacterized protein
MPLKHFNGIFVGYSNKINFRNMKRTIVLGASPNPDRYAYKATKKLNDFGYEAIPIGNKKGEIEGITIRNDTPQYEKVDTITLYLSVENQKPYYDYIISLNPKRIIFNPGTENTELIRIAKEKGIETEIACTLVLLSLGEY